MGQRLGDQGDPLGDGQGVPETAVLLFERDQGAVRTGPRRAPGVGQEHQRKQACYLPILR